MENFAFQGNSSFSDCPLAPVAASFKSEFVDESKNLRPTLFKTSPFSFTVFTRKNDFFSTKLIGRTISPPLERVFVPDSPFCDAFSALAWYESGGMFEKTALPFESVFPVKIGKLCPKLYNATSASAMPAFFAGSTDKTITRTVPELPESAFESSTSVACVSSSSTSAGLSIIFVTKSLCATTTA